MVPLSLSENIRSDVIYLDFAKAIDSDNHDPILKELKHSFGINGKSLCFMKYYLEDRKQEVVMNGSVSKCLQVLSGVPQGSVLGPSLFVLFIHDISASFSPGTNNMLYLYADDTKKWRKMVDEADFNIIQRDINNLLGWACDFIPCR